MNKPLVLNVIGNGLVSSRIQANSPSERPINERFTHTAVLCRDYTDRENNSFVVIESHFSGYQGQNGVVKVPVIDWFNRALEKKHKIFAFEHEELNVGRINAFAEMRIGYDLRNILRHKLANLLGVSKFHDASENKVYCTELIALCDDWHICSVLKQKAHEIVPEEIYKYCNLTNKELIDINNIGILNFVKNYE